MAGAFGCSHEHIDVSGGDNLLVTDVKTVGKSDGVAGRQVGADGLIINIGSALVVDQDHNDISLLSGFGNRVNFKTVLDGFLPGFAVTQANDYIAAAVAQVLGMGMALRTIANDSDLLPLEVFQVAVLFIVHFCLHVIAACHN